MASAWQHPGAWLSCEEADCCSSLVATKGLDVPRDQEEALVPFARLSTCCLQCHANSSPVADQKGRERSVKGVSHLHNQCG